MRIYDLVLVLRSTLTDEKRKKLFETIKGLLKDTKVTKEEEWGKKPLSYPLKKEVAGYYVYLALETESISSDLEKKLRGMDEVLRHLLVRKK